MPKLHKIDIPIRLIVSAYSSTTNGLSWIMDKIFQPILNDIPTIINSSKQFINKLTICDMDWPNSNIYFLTCDIESLYTNIPIDEAITSVLHLFQPKYDHFSLTNNDISTLL